MSIPERKRNEPLPALPARVPRQQIQYRKSKLCASTLVLPLNEKNEKQLLLTDTLSVFAAELRQLLIEKGEPELAIQVSKLMILERCGCMDDICATFYTQPKPNGGYGHGHRNVALTPNVGMVILDVVAEEIACVEVLDRHDVREKLDAVLPCRNLKTRAN
jgi:hypothetical protein